MIKGEPLWWLFYEGNFVGCIFYVYHEAYSNEYEFIGEGEELSKWLREHVGTYKAKKEMRIELTDSSHEDYDFAMIVLKNSIAKNKQS